MIGLCKKCLPNVRWRWALFDIKFDLLRLLIKYISGIFYAIGQTDRLSYKLT